METKPVHEFLYDEDNYLEWSVRVKTHLMAEDLWDIVEATNEPPTPENEAAFKAWRRMNAMALRVIQSSLVPDTFSDIMEITSARIAWETLAEKYKPKGPDPSSSTASVPLEEDNLDSNTSDRMASVPIEEDNLDSNTTPGESDEEGNVDVGVEIYMDYYKALQIGDWNAAKEYLNRHPQAISAKITVTEKTALHVAAEAVHEHIVEELVKEMPAESLEIRDNEGFTALARATYNGNNRMAECMLGKNGSLISIATEIGVIPVVTALHCGYLKLARYLYLFTPLEILMAENGIIGATVICEAVYNKALDIALDLVGRRPQLVVAQDRFGESPFQALACMPDYFLSGNRLVVWERWVYSGIHIQPAGRNDETRLNIPKSVENRSNDNETSGSGLYSLRQLVSNLLTLPGLCSLSQLVSELRTLLGIKHVYEMKLTHSQSNELLSLMKKQLSISNIQQIGTGRVQEAIVRATKEGIFEFVFEIVKAVPSFVWCQNATSSNIFSVAVQYRRAKIFSLIYGLNMKNALASSLDLSDNNLLHMAGMSAASASLNDIPGAALKMQRELQWFKEVESIVPLTVRVRQNKMGLNPRQLFTKNHEDMMSKGEKWMKDTASSCTVVGALIVTIMFAAVFTVPVLMFLGILTSCYAEEDFLKSLPKKMIIGLSTLFFSIVAMMTTFCAALLLMLREQSWTFIPVICLASIPITLFGLLQSPLLGAMVISTYGPSIFNRKMKRWF